MSEASFPYNEPGTTSLRKMPFKLGFEFKKKTTYDIRNKLWADSIACLCQETEKAGALCKGHKIRLERGKIIQDLQEFGILF